MTNWCEFKKFCPRDSWLGLAKEDRPGYGEPSGHHPLSRCPLCNKRLQLKAGYCVGGEFVAWMIPDHKAKEKTKKKGPRRKTKVSGRGK